MSKPISRKKNVDVPEPLQVSDRQFMLMKQILARPDLTAELFDKLGKSDANLILSYCPEPAKILDFGCGIGRILKYMPQSTEGYDIDARMRETAKEWCGREILSSLDGKESTYDVVYAFLVIQHISHKPLCEQEIATVLKPNGKLIVQDTDPKISLLGGYTFHTHFDLVEEKQIDNDILRVYKKKAVD